MECFETEVSSGNTPNTPTDSTVINNDKITLLQSFLQDDPNDSFTRFALAMELHKAGNPAAAEVTYRELLQLDPDYVGVFYHLGKLVETQGCKSEAKIVYENGIACALRINDSHAASELRQALTELEWND